MDFNNLIKLITQSLDEAKALKAESEKIIVRDANLQAAIDNAEAGATLNLLPNFVYTGPVVINKPLTLQVNNWQVGPIPASKEGLPYISAPANAPYSIYITSDNVGIKGIYAEGTSEVIKIGDAKTIVPSYIDLYNNFIPSGKKRGIAANGNQITAIGNFIDDILNQDQDSQAISLWSCLGGNIFQGNFLGTATENFLIGGAPPYSALNVPERITFVHNICWKDPKYRGSGIGKHKNLCEVKFGRYITIEQNLMMNNWQGQQPGESILIVMDTNGPADFCETRDIAFKNNLVLNVAAGINILGHIWNPAYKVGSGQTSDVLIEGNIFDISKANWGGTGRFIQIGGEPKNIIISENTARFDGSSFLYCYYGSKWEKGAEAPVKAGPVTGFRYTLNSHEHRNYGVYLVDIGYNGNGLNTYFPDGQFTQNEIAGTPGPSQALYNTDPIFTNKYPTVDEWKNSFNPNLTKKKWAGAGAEDTFSWYLLNELKRLKGV